MIGKTQEDINSRLGGKKEKRGLGAGSTIECKGGQTNLKGALPNDHGKADYFLNSTCPICEGRGPIGVAPYRPDGGNDNKIGVPRTPWVTGENSALQKPKAQ